MKLHLCLFTDSQEPSGVGEHILTLAGDLAGRYRVSVVCPPTRGGCRLVERVGRLGLETLVLSACYHERDAVRTLARWLRETDVGIFHCHAGVGWEGFGGVEAANAAGVHWIVRTEHLPYLLTHPVQREDHARTVRLVDRLICVSAEAGKSYLRAGVPKQKLRVVRNGIRLQSAFADRSEVLACLGLPPSARIVLTVGRFTEQKGHSDLLTALPDILQRVPEAYFVWVGEGDLEGELRTQARVLGLVEHVRFLGRRDDVPELLAASDVFALPSLFEGLPLVVLEAQAAGLPVVGTQVCGTSEAILDGITGRLVPPGDARALAEAIAGILERPELAARWGEAGQRHVRYNFSAERMARETAAIYEEGDTGDNKYRLYRGRGYSFPPPEQPADLP
ncbi:MAG: glycosyltransferase family 4 protein [Chloroflexia bacterium]